MSEWLKPFRYPKLLTKEQIQQGATPKKKQRSSDWKASLKRIWDVVDEQRLLLIAVLALVLISSLLALAGPFLLGMIIDQYIVPGQMDGLGKMLLLLLAIYFGLSLTMYGQNYWIVGIAQQTVYRLRTALFAKLQKLPISFFDKRQHGEIMSRLTNDIDNISQTLNSSFIQVFSSIITLTGTVAIMLYLSPLLTVLTMTIIPVMFLSMRWITRRTGILFKEQQRALGELNGFIEESISGQAVVKTFSQEARMLEQFQQKSEALKLRGFWAHTYSGYIPKVMNFLNNASFAIVAGVGGWLVLRGDGLVTIGTIVIFSEYARQFTRPLNDLANQFNTVLSALAGAERVFALMDEEEEKDDGDVLESGVIQGDVRFEDVSFGYDETTIVHDLSFHVKRGESVAFVGPTGAGKTTIMQLISRFYDTSSGTIYIDGQPIETIARSSLRSEMAFVLQDSFLFEMTVRDNIRYGRLDATESDIIEAAKRANAHHFIMKLSDGYDTIIESDGGQLSQGERQLLSIARAFVANPKILLLDEATSSIDTLTELHIQEALERLMEGRTSFIIAHRLNTVRQADTVYVLRDGCIVESGSQQQLIEKRGIYYDMLQQQKNGGSL